MKKRTRTVLGTAVGLAAASVAMAVQAHDPGVFLNVRWQPGQSVPYLFAPDFPGGSYRDRVVDGASQWRSHSGPSEPQFYNAGTAQTEVAPDTCIASFNTPNQIHWDDLDYYSSSTIGLTSVCYNGYDNRIYSFQMSFDTDRDWYTGTGDANDGFLQSCVPSCQTDLWSIASHEMGHAHGYMGGIGGHFDESDSICPDDDSRHTMCPGYRPGSERYRTIESHDIHTYQGAY